MNATSGLQNKPTPAVPTLVERFRNLLRPRRRKHDPLLVLNLATFNAGGGWAQVLNPLKVRESVG